MKKVFATGFLFFAIVPLLLATTVTVVTGSGTGFLDFATQEAIREMQNKCISGRLSNIQTVGVITRADGFYTVEMVGTCTR